MARKSRFCEAGYAYHVVNRVNARHRVFYSTSDYLAFIRVLKQGLVLHKVHLHAYCIMPNHWHLVLTPRTDDALPTFMSWVSNTHTRRYRIFNATWGEGPVYQGRYWSSPIRDDTRVAIVCRYVERNPVASGLVARAEFWRWSSAARVSVATPPLVTGHLPPRDKEWRRWVNTPLSAAEISKVKTIGVLDNAKNLSAFQEGG